MTHPEQQAQWERQDGLTAAATNDLRNDFIEAGIDPDSAQCDAVWDAIRLAKIDDGNFDSAKSRATRVIKSVKPKEVKAEVKLEDEEKRISDMAEAKALEILKKTPGWKSHDGEPSGGSRQNYTMAEFRARETEIRSLPSGERAAARKELKNAFNEGRVT